MNKYLDTRNKMACTGSDIIHNFVTHDRRGYHDSIGIEEQIRRLTDIMGRVADAANVNLLEITESHEVAGMFSFHPEGIETDWSR